MFIIGHLATSYHHDDIVRTLYMAWQRIDMAWCFERTHHQYTNMVLFQSSKWKVIVMLFGNRRLQFLFTDANVNYKLTYNKEVILNRIACCYKPGYTLFICSILELCKSVVCISAVLMVLRFVNEEINLEYLKMKWIWQ